MAAALWVMRRPGYWEETRLNENRGEMVPAQVIDFMHVPGQRTARRTRFLWKAGTPEPVNPRLTSGLPRVGKELTPKRTAPAVGARPGPS